MAYCRAMRSGQGRCCRTCAGRAPRALAALRDVALSLLHLRRGAHLTAAREYHAGYPAVLFRRLDLTQRRL